MKDRERWVGDDDAGSSRKSNDGVGLRISINEAQTLHQKEQRPSQTRPCTDEMGMGAQSEFASERDQNRHQGRGVLGAASDAP